MLSYVIDSDFVDGKVHLRRNLAPSKSGITSYRVILKKVSFGILRIIFVSKERKYFTLDRKQRQRPMSVQILMIFGQNHQN